MPWQTSARQMRPTAPSATVPRPCGLQRPVRDAGLALLHAQAVRIAESARGNPRWPGSSKRDLGEPVSQDGGVTDTHGSELAFPASFT
jgi:hypothetical protein